MKDLLVSLLEILAMLAFAVGATGALWQFIGWSSVCVGALVVGTGAWVAGRPATLNKPRE